ncbi:MAG: thiolase family protein [Acidimicrobiales bacterium]
MAIIGVGLHPFGRFGDKTAIDMGADAIRAACADAGVGWNDVQFAFGGSFEVDNPDAVVGRVGMTGIPFTDVYNGCATAAAALDLTADAIRSGTYDIGVAVGMDKHPPGAFTSDPSYYGAPPWYGEIGHFLTTKFFAMKINRYMHDHGISHESLARVAAKNFRNGALNPNAFRRKPSRGRDPVEHDAQLPAHAVHVLQPRRGPRRRCCAGPTSRTATRRRRSTFGPRHCAPARTAPTRCTVRGRRSSRTTPPRCTSQAAYEMAGIGPEDVDVVQLQDTDSGRRSSTWPRTGSVPTATRNGCWPTATPRSVAVSR